MTQNRRLLSDILEVRVQRRNQNEVFLDEPIPLDRTSCRCVGWATASGVELAIDFSQMSERESSMAIFSYFYGQPENYGGVTLDDLQIYNACLTLNEVAEIVKNGHFDTSGFNVAYQTGGEFISFDQPNTNYIKCDSGTAWKLKNPEGSLKRNRTLVRKQGIRCPRGRFYPDLLRPGGGRLYRFGQGVL